MIPQSQVYSPIQNISIWLGAWLYGHESYDALDEALYYLDGPRDLELLRTIRQHITPCLYGEEPPIRLVLAGPGHPPTLPPGPAADMAMDQGAIIFKGDRTHYAMGMDGYLHDVGEFLPAPAYFTPGQADQQLSQATYAAADLIDQPIDMPKARLRVGYLADHYDNPGLPSHIPERAGKLIARADRVAAIIEASEYQTGDMHLIALWRHIRQARMTAVEHIIASWADGA